ncbi:MAG: hypothetical protein ABI338_00385 [Gemmatimonadaceae bacterium]
MAGAAASAVVVVAAAADLAVNGAIILPCASTSTIPDPGSVTAASMVSSAASSESAITTDSGSVTPDVESRDVESRDVVSRMVAKSKGSMHRDAVCAAATPISNTGNALAAEPRTD